MADQGAETVSESIRRLGARGECLRVDTPHGPVYWTLDGAAERWARKRNRERRICFTVSEIGLMLSRGLTQEEVGTVIEAKRHMGGTVIE